MSRFKKNPNLAFQGSLTIPLDADTKEEYKRYSIQTGEWITKAERILKKPRWYRIEIFLYDTDGAQFHSINAFDKRLARDEISQVIHKLLVDVMEEFPDVELDKKASRAKLLAIKPKK